MHEIDKVEIVFNSQAQEALKYILGFITFGMALDLRWADMRKVLAAPRALFFGMFGQLLLFPFCTFVLAWLLSLSPSTELPRSVALGMFLVAACPGGNISNLFSHYSRGNTMLSVSLSGVSTLLAVLATPINFAFWSGLYFRQQGQLDLQLSLSTYDVFQSVLLLLGIPIVLGIFAAQRFPRLAQVLRRPMKIASLSFFLLLVVGALAANLGSFWEHIGSIAPLVALHNAVALSLGYFGSRALALGQANTRSLTIEIGIQNSGLGLILFFEHFPEGYGGVGFMAAWWGIWHIVTGLSLVAFWSRRGVEE